MKNKCKCPTVASPNPKEPNGVLINEAQLVLAEKRTSMAVMRTGIAVFAIPMSILGLLIATSKYYDVVHVMNLMIPLVFLNSFLILSASFLLSSVLQGALSRLSMARVLLRIP